MSSGLHEGTVHHRRLGPASHAPARRIAMACIDLVDAAARRPTGVVVVGTRSPRPNETPGARPAPGQAA
ncbi:MAG: hypothetical protein ACYCTE_07455 [Acidimicrobiales bacterium]